MWRVLASLRIGILLFACSSALSVGTAAAAYPERPIRILTPFSAGSVTDVIARTIGSNLSEAWGQPVVVDNRAGAGGVIAAEIVAKSPPDGYTLLIGATGPTTVNPSLVKNLPYDAARAFAPITLTAANVLLMSVAPTVPAKSVKELIALAKARPGEIVYGSSGHGTNPHLTIELFASMAQIRLLHVPYKGTAPGLIDLLAGRVAMMATSSMSLIVPHLRAERLRALGISTAARSRALPDIPTIAEAGVPGYESVQWSGLLAPAGTPQEIIAKLHQEAVSILRAPEVRERLAGDSAEVVASSPEEFAAFMKAETIKWAKVVKAAGIRPE